jgi:hypothetical protein
MRTVSEEQASKRVKPNLPGECEEADEKVATAAPAAPSTSAATAAEKEDEGQVRNVCIKAPAPLRPTVKHPCLVIHPLCRSATR